MPPESRGQIGLLDQAYRRAIAAWPLKTVLTFKRKVQDRFGRPGTVHWTESSRMLPGRLRTDDVTPSFLPPEAAYYWAR